MGTVVSSPEAKIVGKNRIKALAFFVMAAVVGLLGLFLFMRYLDQIKSNVIGNGTNTVGIETVPVIVAAMDLPIATTLEKKHLSIIQWPKEDAPEGIYQTSNAVIGRTTLQSLIKGEPVLAPRIADSNTHGMAALLSPGKRAMAVKVDSVVGVAGFVQPGDFVDVITTMKPDDETKETLESEAARMSKIILQNIKVLAVGEHLSKENKNPLKVKVVTLEVSAEESEKLALGSQHGQIQLTMRSKIDQSEEVTAGITPLRLLVPETGEEETEVVVQKPEVAQGEKTQQRKRKRAKKKEESENKETARRPTPPVVEILRGGEIEERKLRSYHLNE